MAPLLKVESLKPNECMRIASVAFVASELIGPGTPKISRFVKLNPCGGGEVRVVRVTVELMEDQAMAERMWAGEL